MTVINLDQIQRFRLQSATNIGYIRNVVSDLLSRMQSDGPRIRVFSLTGMHLRPPVSLGDVGVWCQSPYPIVEFLIQGSPFVKVSLGQDTDGTWFKIEHSPSNFFEDAYLHGVITPTLSLIKLFLKLSPVQENHSHEVHMLVNALHNELPTIVGYLLTVYLRNRFDYRLEDPLEYTIRGSNNTPTQYVGDVKHVLNPRENHTGISKRPHERAGHYRTMPNGDKRYISPTTVHKDEYEPDGRPRVLKR